MAIDDSEHWRLRLVELIGALKVSQREFSDATGIDPSYVSRLLYEPSKKGRKNLGLGNIAAIRRCFQLAPGWFEMPLGSGLENLPDRSTVAVPHDPIQLEPERRATLRYAYRAGVVQGGDNGFIENFHSDPTAQEPEPVPYASTRQDENAYAVKVRGSSMEPTIMAGWDVVASPSRPAEPPDLCVVYFANDRKALKRLLWQRDGMVCLESISPGHAKITEPLENIVRMDKVISIVPN